MKELLKLLLAVFIPLQIMAAPSITSVSAQPHSPRDGKIGISIAIVGSMDESAALCFKFLAINTETKSEVAVTHISQEGDIEGSGMNWTRRFVWDALADVGPIKIDDIALTIKGELPVGGVQLWDGGPYWSECNVGATKPEEYGYYFGWGDTIGYTRSGGVLESDSSYSGVEWVTSAGIHMTSSPFITTKCPTYNKNNSWLISNGYIDSAGTLTSEHDAATAHLGAPWRMATDAELTELISNKCDTRWTNQNGVYGRLIKGKGDYSSRSIFIPAAGFGSGSYLRAIGSYASYWSSTSHAADSRFAWYLYFYSGDFTRSYCNRFNGQPVRPVRDASDSTIIIDKVTAHFSYDYRNMVQIELSSNAISEWVAYDLADMFATKHGVNAKGYRDLFKAKFGEDYVAALQEETGKTGLDNLHLCVWHDYVFGTDPLDIDSKFAADITVSEDGKPVVSWNPDLGEERTYKILGSTDLKTWAEVPEGHEADYNFFKVTVEMK